MTRYYLIFLRPDNWAKDNSTDLKFRQFNQKYADNLANNSDHRSRVNVLRARQQRVGLDRLVKKIRLSKLIWIQNREGKI